MSSVLGARGLTLGYNGVPVVHDMSFEVCKGEIVALLGANGAGKTTSLLGLAGEITPIEGEVTWNGEVVGGSLHRRCRDGLGFVTEERSVFMRMTARDNIRLGKCDEADVVRLFPELTPHLDRMAGLLSGGQQQMLTLARALARKPTALLADELSLGLAPLLVDRLIVAVREAADDGLGVVLVEQHVRKALRVADRVCVMRRGRVIYTGSAREARRDIDKIEASYLSR